MFGRIRKIPRRYHNKAFNTIIQSSAADIMKLLTIELHKYCKKVQDTNIVCIVHDDWLFECPKEKEEERIRDIKNIIEGIDVGLKVPIYCSVGSSEDNWREC